MAYKEKAPLPISEGGTGTITAQTTDGVVIGGASSYASTAAGTTNTVLLGNTSSAPSFGQVPNAALVNNTITVSAGTNISVSGSPVALGGTVTISATGGFAGSYIQTNHAASPYTALSTDYYIAVDPSAGTVSILLPNAPTNYRLFVIKDYTGASATHNITVTTVGGTVLIDAAATFVMNNNYQSVSLIFDGTNYEIY